MTLVDTDLPVLRPIHYYFTSVASHPPAQRGKEGNAYAYLNSFKVRLSSILLYWFCLDRNRKYLNLTWVPVLLLCPYDVIHESITLLALNASI